ncbi:MAG: hypothetical protein KJT01_13205 [Gemmatimonadetes bacterium]|nr:hypothetical protein [Gemmatimonadota bacterium]
MADQPQSFANHTRFHPPYHFFTVPATLVYLIWTVQRLVANPGADTAYALVGALAIFGAGSVARLSPLRAQDRLIRLEERLRLARLLPADLQPKIETLRPSHLVALRFASDAEVEGLVRKVLANPAMTTKEIKQQIRDWRPDHFRV